MFVVLVVLGLAATALAKQDCGPLQSIQVKRNWADAYGIGHREEFATAVWHEYFDEHPDRHLFDRVHGYNIHSAEFKAHMVRVFAGFDLIVSILDDEPVFNQATSHYANFHKKFGGIPFKDFGAVLIDVLPNFVHGHFDHDAWVACYDKIESHMH